MSEGDESRVGSLVDRFEQLPAAHDAESKPAVSGDRLFGRQRSVHELLGGGKTADIILWRRKGLSAAILAAATGVWILFEWLGYHLLPVLCGALIFALASLFVWSNAAVFLKRSPPPVPSAYISEDMAVRAAELLRAYLNQMVTMLHEVMLGKDVKLFLKIEVGLWLLSLIGKWGDFLTLVYICVILVLTVPLLYQRHEDKVDRTVQRGIEQTQKLHGKVQERILNRIPKSPLKEKKSQ